MRILFINHLGGGFAGYVEVPDGTTRAIAPTSANDRSPDCDAYRGDNPNRLGRADHVPTWQSVALAPFERGDRAYGPVHL